MNATARTPAPRLLRVKYIGPVGTGVQFVHRYEGEDGRIFDLPARLDHEEGAWHKVRGKWYIVEETDNGLQLAHNNGAQVNKMAQSKWEKDTLNMRARMVIQERVVELACKELARLKNTTPEAERDNLQAEAARQLFNERLGDG